VTERIVVGAAIFDRGRVLAALRSAPSASAGQWEFPGGKVELGESDADALVRECREELGIEIGVRSLLGTQPLGEGVKLRLYAAELLFGEPMALQDHGDVRWFRAADLGTVPWLDADRDLLPAVREQLRY
jgi:8-oxo-dGTP diphosphatase